MNAEEVVARAIGCRRLESHGEEWCDEHGFDWPCKTGRVLAALRDAGYVILTPERVWELRELHAPTVDETPSCLECDRPFPCETLRIGLEPLNASDPPGDDAAGSPPVTNPESEE